MENAIKPRVFVGKKNELNLKVVTEVTGISQKTQSSYRGLICIILVASNDTVVKLVDLT